MAVPVGTTAAANGYWEYLPPSYSNGPAPLLVFWHGLGENGDGSLAELDRVDNAGPPRLINQDQWPNDRPFVVLSPQQPGGGCPSAATVKAFFDYALVTYNIDETRVYLTGLSCGAIGGWNYLGQNSNTTPVAAAVLIAGDGRSAFNSAGCDLADNLAIWGFHGDPDGTVPTVGTTLPMEGLMACPDPKEDLRLTLYPGVGHSGWRQTYDLSAGHDIYTWMLAQQQL